MSVGITIAKGITTLCLLSKMANRHGLIAGATGTGKTVSLRVLVEGLSEAGIPTFLADVKGDLTGIRNPGEVAGKIKERVDALGLAEFVPKGFPVVFWDVFGEQGHPVRATISQMGPLLLGRLLNLNETQQGVLSLVFKIADDNGMLLLDLKDLRAMVQHVGDNAKEFTTEYGNIAPASIGAIQRALLTLEQQGGEKFFGEPSLNLQDLLQTDSAGQGVVNLLSAGRLMQSPKVYSTFLLWLLSELFEELPEVGDVEKPKLVFFFDEAHLLFNEAPNSLLEKIEQVVRLIRSKGVGVYFISQNPLDIPDRVLGQLGNRIQHALRAFTPRDQKAVRAAAETFRSDGKLDVEKAIGELAVGEALVSLLDDQGTPGIVERALVVPPRSQLRPLSAQEIGALIKSSVVFGHYEKAIDRESAYELLKGKLKGDDGDEGGGIDKTDKKIGSPVSAGVGVGGMIAAAGAALGGGRSQGRQTVVEALFNSAARAIGSQVGRQLIRGVLGSLVAGSGSRRR